MKLLGCTARLYRKRRREGMQYVRIPSRAKEVKAAVLGVFHSAMDQERRGWLYRARLPINARR